MADGATVTATEIARLAGVGRAAVSNWRRRHEDFPMPVGGTATSPTFSLAEVESWLNTQGKLTKLGGVLPPEERLWQQLRAVGDDLRLADIVGLIGRFLVYVQRGERFPQGTTPWTKLAGQGDAAVAKHLPPAVAAATAGLARDDELTPAFDVGLVRTIADLAAERGTTATFDLLLQRYVKAHSRRVTPTSSAVAALMADLAGPIKGTIFDPACGTGTLLRTATERATGSVHPVGQELDPALGRLAAIRLALSVGDSEVRFGDSLGEDAYPGLVADVVLCNPPYNERGWARTDAQAFDPRWEYGEPPATESELAWVQHALAHVKPGGRLVMLLPPSVAARRSGRRIRAELIRRGALRAVIALPSGFGGGAALPLHLWVLRRPDGQQLGDLRVLLVDLTNLDETERSKAAEHALTAWQRFEKDPTADLSERAVAKPVIDLLDDEVDLTPGRHVAPPPPVDLTERLGAATDTLRRLFRELPRTLPIVTTEGARRNDRVVVSIAELARSGALVIRQQTLGFPIEDAGDGTPVLVARDVVANRPPSGRLPDGADEARLVRVQPGDVVVPALGTRLVARVLPDGDAVLGAQLWLLRPRADAIDPYFLAGFLRSSANARQAGGTLPGSRIDVRRASVPRLPLIEQRQYGAMFRRLATLEEALSQANALGKDVVQLVTDGLADGGLAPSGQR